VIIGQCTFQAFNELDKCVADLAPIQELQTIRAFIETNDKSWDSIVTSSPRQTSPTKLWAE